jgi:hypothetical protein
LTSFKNLRAGKDLKKKNFGEKLLADQAVEFDRNSWS